MRNNKLKKIFNIFALILTIIALLTGCSTQQIEEKPFEPENPAVKADSEQQEQQIDEAGYYTSPEEVALYIHTYNKLPSNYITKKEATTLGWKSSEGNLWEVTDKKSIGGDLFGNREGSLPKKDGRKYFECDVNYEGGFRGSERLVYSDDGLIYYTSDHYKTFTQLY